MLIMHFGVKTLSNLPNLTFECLPACYFILLTDVWVLPESGRCRRGLQQVLQRIWTSIYFTPPAPPSTYTPILCLSPFHPACLPL